MMDIVAYPIPHPMLKTKHPVLVSDRLYTAIQGDREAEWLQRLASIVSKLHDNSYLSDLDKTIRVGTSIIKLRFTIIIEDNVPIYLISDYTE